MKINNYKAKLFLCIFAKKISRDRRCFLRAFSSLRHPTGVKSQREQFLMVTMRTLAAEERRYVEHRWSRDHRLYYISYLYYISCIF